MRRKNCWTAVLVLAADDRRRTVHDPAPAAGARRTIYMSAVEYKGGANVADETYPPAAEPGTKALAPLGGGYDLAEPDATGRWEVESYRFEPGFTVVRKGERVTLEIVGINGALHEAYLIAPSGAKTDVVITRGRMTLGKFRPTELGLWKLICETHPPAMTADILVID
jgi:hypothetical protein